METNADTDQYHAITVEVQKLRLKPGDALIIRARDPIRASDVEAFRNVLRYLCPEGVKGVALNAGITIEVLTPDQNTADFNSATAQPTPGTDSDAE